MSNKKNRGLENQILKIHDNEFLSPDVPLSDVVSHSNWQKYLYSIGNEFGVKSKKDNNYIVIVWSKSPIKNNLIKVVSH